jgi:hypothetical protein
MKVKVPKATRVRPMREKGFGARLYLDELIVRAVREKGGIEVYKKMARLFEKKWRDMLASTPTSVHKIP